MGMKLQDSARVEAYLRRLFRNDLLNVVYRPKDGSAEVLLDEEFIGILFQDDEDGEISYSFTMAILEEDLPQMRRR
ncbi:MAG: DUF3126 family protein [Rhodospirillales bacterium]